MLWLLFAVFGAFFQATYFTLTKKLLENVNQHILAGCVFFDTFIVLFFISMINGMPEIGYGFYSSVLATVLLNVIATIMYFKALKITDLSLAIPMISFTPLFLILTSFILLNEIPTINGIVGIFLIFLGSYILNIDKTTMHLLDPFREIFKNKGIVYMLIVAFLFSISSNFDKLVVINSDPFFGSSIVFLLLSFSFIIISHTTIKISDIKRQYIGNFYEFLFAGIITALSAITINIALTMQIVPYVISIKRLSILFSVLYGSLIFKEENIIMRCIGSSIMLIGVVFITLC